MVAYFNWPIRAKLSKEVRIWGTAWYRSVIPVFQQDGKGQEKPAKPSASAQPEGDQASRTGKDSTEKPKAQKKKTPSAAAGSEVQLLSLETDRSFQMDQDTPDRSRADNLAYCSALRDRQTVLLMAAYLPPMRYGDPYGQYGYQYPPWPLMEEEEVPEKDALWDDDQLDPRPDAPEADDDDENGLDLLESFHRDEGETGPAINENVAKMVNDLWAKGRDPKIIKTLCEQYPTPENTLQVGKVDLNEEVISAIPKHVRARDLKIQAIQGVMARAAVPAVKIVDSLYAKKEVTKQEHINMAIDCLSLVASANASVNQLRRDMLRPSLARKYQLLCNSAPKPPSKLLLGDNLADRVKQANATSSLMTRGIGRGRVAARGRHHPYAPMPGPYQYGYLPYMMPGVQGQYRPRGRGFLGEYQNDVVLKETEATKNVFPSMYDKNTVSSLFLPRPEQPGARAMEQEGQRGQGNKSWFNWNETISWVQSNR